MATFKVGQRVRVIGQWPSEPTPLIGREGVIVRRPNARERSAIANFCTAQNWIVHIPGFDSSGPYANLFAFPAHQLAPLDDPKADAFVERIKSMKPYEEPLTVKDPVAGNLLRIRLPNRYTVRGK